MKKSIKIKILEKILRFMAVTILKIRKPIIIGVTGSVGKTSTKEAIFSVLSSEFKVRKSEKNYNNEIGVPLTIIGVESGGNSILKWLNVFLRWIIDILFVAKYPKILILELGIDRPGDMEYLTSFIPIDVGVITNISSSHLEFFKSINHIAKEKGKLFKAVKSDGLAIFNFDDDRIKSMAEKLKVETLSFGIEDGSNVRGTDIKFNYVDSKISGLVFKLNYQGKIIPIRLSYILAHHQVYSVLAAVAVGIHFKMNLVDITSSLENLMPAPGRMNLLEGERGSLIIDDSYNASPISTLAALKTMEKIESKRKIIVLGDMFELGKDSDEGHKRVINKALSIDSELIFLVGDQMKKIMKKNFPSSDKIIFFKNSQEVAKEVYNILQEGDLILIKGSQAMRMELIVKKIIKNPEKAKKLLCRQSKNWLK